MLLMPKLVLLKFSILFLDNIPNAQMQFPCLQRISPHLAGLAMISSKTLSPEAF